MTKATVSQDGSNAPDETAAFFDEVKNGRDETTQVSGGYGSYPRIYIVELGDEVFYGFDTSLDESRGPWLAGYRDADSSGGSMSGVPPVWFDRDDVFNAETLEQVGPNSVAASAVNALIETHENGLVTDGGQVEDDADDESDDSDNGLGPLFE